MARLPLTYPPMTIATLARIYSQALRLRVKGHPGSRTPGPFRGPGVRTAAANAQ